MYGYKGVKWLEQICVTDRVADGYWEQRGYDRDAWVGGSNGLARRAVASHRPASAAPSARCTGCTPARSSSMLATGLVLYLPMLAQVVSTGRW